MLNMGLEALPGWRRGGPLRGLAPGRCKNWLFRSWCWARISWRPQRQRARPGAFPATPSAFNAFVLGSVRFMTPDHIFYTRLEVDGGASAQEGLQDLPQDPGRAGPGCPLHLPGVVLARALRGLRCRAGRQPVPGPPLLRPGRDPARAGVRPGAEPGGGPRPAQRAEAGRLLRPARASRRASAWPSTSAPRCCWICTSVIGLGSRQALGAVARASSARASPAARTWRWPARTRCASALAAELVRAGGRGGHADRLGGRLFNWFMIDTEFDMLEPFYSGRGQPHAGLQLEDHLQPAPGVPSPPWPTWCASTTTSYSASSSSSSSASRCASASTSSEVRSADAGSRLSPRARCLPGAGWPVAVPGPGRRQAPAPARPGARAARAPGGAGGRRRVGGAGRGRGGRAAARAGGPGLPGARLPARRTPTWWLPAAGGGRPPARRALGRGAPAGVEARPAPRPGRRPSRCACWPTRARSSGARARPWPPRGRC
ncbi:MAG: hypothetical protein MZV63_37455 [Marinilabiliales bacterium]|nr:hypothetical protein [Marinilabiliales bacterium]